MQMRPARAGDIPAAANGPPPPRLSMCANDGQAAGSSSRTPRPRSAPQIISRQASAVAASKAPRTAT
jgi:hypothetical protein